MTITRKQLAAVLESLEPWRHEGTDWRKIKRGGRPVRFVNWRKLSATKSRAD